MFLVSKKLLFAAEIVIFLILAVLYFGEYISRATYLLTNLAWLSLFVIAKTKKVRWYYISLYVVAGLLFISNIVISFVRPICKPDVFIYRTITDIPWDDNEYLRSVGFIGQDGAILHFQKTYDSKMTEGGTDGDSVFLSVREVPLESVSEYVDFIPEEGIYGRVSYYIDYNNPFFEIINYPNRVTRVYCIYCFDRFIRVTETTKNVSAQPLFEQYVMDVVDAKTDNCNL